MDTSVMHQQPDQPLADADAASLDHSARTRLDPYVPRDSAWTCRINAVSHYRRIIVADMGRRR